jgi:hypothetical protein
LAVGLAATGNPTTLTSSISWQVTRVGGVSGFQAHRRFNHWSEGRGHSDRERKVTSASVEEE